MELEFHGTVTGAFGGIMNKLCGSTYHDLWLLGGP